MTYRGKVKNGVVVLDDPKAIPEGVEVSVRPLKGTTVKARGRKRPRSFYERYRRFIGAVKDLPADMSVNLDHYLYGAPKRK